MLNKSYIGQLTEFQILDVYDYYDLNLKSLNSKSQIQTLIKTIEDSEGKKLTINLEQEI